MSIRDVAQRVSAPLAYTPSAAEGKPEVCANCEAVLTGPYCAQCGQKVVPANISLREFLHETTHELTEWDGKVPQTLKTLVFRPGQLTIDFLAGKRARWLAPLRLYLLCSVAYFLTAPLLEAVTHRAARQTARVTITSSSGQATLSPEERRQIAEGIPGRLFGVDRLERAAMHGDELSRTIRAAFPKAMFVLLPLFAFFTYVAWRRHQRRYPAHVYLALHLHAAWFVALTVMAIATGFVLSPTAQSLIALVTIGYVLWYSIATFRNVFGESRARTLGKVAIVALVYLPCWAFASLALLGYALATM